ncbi:LOW QUALITY PROTEIN: ubiquilin-1-like [Varanus komodoensis]|uniref:LOW QUALITY PROTEIN: ubiquilin-1-like n=1 Tax=Varanus komodoensis TaxID=61221 RepID=UPI001CF7A8F2|nr:LOW QUALITY PROTEIN: ubiquilin-1-like [Varanus komodoensis]
MSESKEPAGNATGTRVVKVTVKTLKRKEQFEVAESTVVRDFKKIVSERFEASSEQLSLIFAGEILKDQSTLLQHKIGDGSKVHLFITSQRRPPGNPELLLGNDAATAFLCGPPANASLPGERPSGPSLALSEWSGQPEELMASCHELVAQMVENLLLQIITLNLDASALNSNPLLLGFLVGVTGMTVLGLNVADVSDFVHEAPEQVVTRQELLSEAMNHPLVQNLFGDTEQVRQMLLSVPQMRQLAEQNPEIHHILNNAEFLREMVDVATSPAALDEIIRSHDRALSNLESIPGGYSALQQLYSDIEAPVLDAVQAQLQGHPFAPPEDKPSLGGASPLARTENREPLPNPWAPPANSGGDTVCGADGGPSPAIGQGYVLLALGPGLRPGPSKSENVQAMVHQLTENLEFMQSVSAALSRPDGPTQAFLSHRGSSAGHEGPQPPGWVQRLPPELARSEAAALLTNPRAVRALLQLQMSLLTLAREVPDFLQALADPEADPESMEDSDEGGSPLSEAGSLELESSGSRTGEEEAEEAIDVHMEQPAPAALYRLQLEQLSAMGFRDPQRNLQALIDTEGDLGAAIERLTNFHAS